MRVLAVDLAAKYSAVCLMDDTYRVLDQFDSWQITENKFIRLLLEFFDPYRKDQPDLMAIEDLPHGLNYNRIVKAVCRLQGRIHQSMLDAGASHRVVYVSPSAWRANFPGMQRGTGPGVVVPVAARYGYFAPNLFERAKGHGGKSRAEKVASDYCSAYLIGRWAVDTKNKHRTWDVPGTSRYETAEILKKDFHAEDL